MARSNNVIYNRVYVTADEAEKLIEETKSSLIKLIHQTANHEKGTLVIDFTLIKKVYAHQIDRVTYDYDGNTKRSCKGLSTGFAVWTNEKVTIPCDFLFWQRKKDFGELYKKKSELVKELVIALRPLIPFSEVRLDGAFASHHMIDFFEEQKLNYTIRIPRNRVVRDKKGLYQLKNHPVFKFKRNQKYKTIRAYYKDIQCYFTAQKCRGRKGTNEIIFIVSNIWRTAKNHVKYYNRRWCVEKFIRTAKQHLGLGDCQSTSEKKQQAHIYLVMYAYAILEVNRNYKRKKFVESVLHSI